ncbi:phosphoribosyltransferase family protein [Caulobacter hibisci]|uniref:Phosphoribosyltransferase n=1 Tax=Caulobacter hibisci TaxID=2035993 RepID=A0ABS0T7H7_9CAUL|nr:phosphoribosyltransferase family protein [Caulobacter hibisci]MBI1687015.1 phosphoribosyltransferase [Caulobacter hibisci]
MHFRSIADLHADILSGLHKIPRDVDVVVGVARSGMLPATMIALALNVPLAEMNSFAHGRLLGSGKTRRVKRMNVDFEDVRHALVVDDSIDTGGSMLEARAVLAPLADRIKFTFLAAYGVKADPAPADVILATVPQPRVFEWNALHHAILSRACVDIDGVLCHDPTDEENDDGERYLRFLTQARPRTIPTKKIASLVTSRLEKYRPETEAWLKANGVEYGELIMLDLPTAEERRRAGVHGSFKGEYYKRSKAEIFIESELAQAQTIANISGKPVLSLEGPVMCEPGNLSPVRLAARAIHRSPLRKLVSKIKWRLVKAVKA